MDVTAEVGDKIEVEEEEEEVTFKSRVAPKQLWQSFTYVIGQITVEPLMFYHTFAAVIAHTLASTFVMNKICQQGSNWFSNGTSFDEDICQSLDNGEYDEIQKLVQKTNSRMRLVESYIAQVPAVFFILFGSAWSDRNGRKVIILLPWIGQMVGNIYFMLHAIFYDQTEPDWLIFVNVVNILGGTVSFYLGIYSYISDVSSVENRVTRIMLCDLWYYAAKIIAAAVAGPLYSALGYLSNIAIAVVADIIGILHLLIFIKETKGRSKGSSEKAERESRNAFLNTLSLLKDSVIMLFKKRTHSTRHLIWLVLLAFLLNNVARGDHTVDVPYIRRIFEWKTIDTFNIWWGNYTSVTTCLSILAIILLPMLNKLVDYHDSLLAIISAISSLAMALVYLLAWTPGSLYLANVVGTFSNVATSALRSLSSKLVDADETGKIMGSCALLQAITGMIRPLYNILYNLTLDWFVGFIYCLAIILYVLMIVTLIYIFFFLRRLRKNEDETGTRIA